MNWSYRRIDGDWWQVAGNPDLGESTSDCQELVDFGVWQAADGTWQLWSCIRKTNCGGNTRLFHGWEGEKLTDKNWQPLGITMQADPKFGESPGGLQAPHVVRVEGTYYMFYGDWANICMATSKGGKTFSRVVQKNGKTGMFNEGEGEHARDPMILKATLPVAAPEIIYHDDSYFIASLKPTLDGIQIARLKWVAKGG